MQHNTRYPYYYGPEGRLVLVDSALEAVNRGSTTIGIKTPVFALISSHIKPTKPLVEPAEKIFTVDGHIGATGSGYIGANFIKNLVFSGGPRAKPGIISIKDADTLESNIDSFNHNFSKVGIAVEKHDVVIECREELEKLKRRKEYDRISSYRWLSEWLNLF